MIVDERAALAEGLKPGDLDRAVALLGREITVEELAVLAAMWSEHCSYRSSRHLLARLPTDGPRVVHGPGENAGVVDLGDGDLLVFKMESHNHPSFIEPFQGAATGVGGILRDVFAMGARPIAVLDALRFGRLAAPRMRHLAERVVAGIAAYGNAFGVPNVGGDLDVDESYDGNILVNVMALGTARAGALFLGRASGPGNPVLYLGARTGRDGIHGASMASSGFATDEEARRPTVQVGDPFLEKVLLEACLELMASGLVLGVQDMGAAGLTSSAVEMAARGGVGLRLDLDRVPRRARGMTAREILLSESQERMLLVTWREALPAIAEVCRRWEIECSEVGEVAAGDRFTVVAEGRVVVDLPIGVVVDGAAPRSVAPVVPPREATLSVEELPCPARLDDALLDLLAAPAVASKEWIYRQYDHQVRLGTVRGPGVADAAVLRLLGGRKGIAATVDGSGRLCRVDPAEGARQAVAEAFRNLCCVGAEPLAVTDCLNLGSPEQPEVAAQLAAVVDGIAEACRALGTPVVSGNVSLYNSTDGRAIDPTPMIGMVGLLDDVRLAGVAGFPRAGLSIALLGEAAGALDGSLHLRLAQGLTGSRLPRVDLARERAVGRLTMDLVRRRLALAAHDCSTGGLAVALAEMALLAPLPVGVDVDVPGTERADVGLFAEGPSRILVAVDPAVVPDVDAAAAAAGVPVAWIGSAGGRRLVLRVAGRSVVDLPIDEAARAWRSLGATLEV